MPKKRLQTTLVLLLIVTFSFQTFSQKTFNPKSEQTASETDFQISGSERFVMHALRTIHSAQMAYAATLGAGNYGGLNDLSAADLIDARLASGERYGYRFTVAARNSSTAVPLSFEVKAVPVIKRARRLSFYINEICEIRGAAKSGREATAADPVIEPCGASPRSENERLSIISLRTVAGAQATYQATYGNGDYGTFAQLSEANLIALVLAAGTYRGYIYQLTVTARSDATPARFSLKAVPLEYGKTGIRSFYLDETGVVRGADKGGQPADANDPPIEN
jgi:type IV pilus assembly protein PilA